jgi:Peptidase family M23
VQIIVVHPRLGQALSINIDRRRLFAAGAVVLLLIGGISGLLTYLTANHGPAASAFGSNLAGFRFGKDSAESQDPYLRQNIDALAIKLGHLQAKLSRLDAIGERVASMAGIKPADLPNGYPGRGGPLLTDMGTLSLFGLSREVDNATNMLDSRGDYLSMVESELVRRTVTTKLLPTNQPLLEGMPGSRYGWRIDPFTGLTAMHEGIDFGAPIGTPILAAGAGVVVVAGANQSYGNHVDIDHGNGVLTRYAHASKLLVQQGDIVKQGQKIAEVGTTGRSTGAHLHFEVRVAEAAKDPLRYLQAGLNLRNGLADASLMLKSRSGDAPPAPKTRLADARAMTKTDPAEAPMVIKASLTDAPSTAEPIRRVAAMQRPCPAGETRQVRRGRAGACVINSGELAVLSRPSQEPDSSGSISPASNDPELPHEDLRQPQRAAVEELQQDSR